MLRASTMQRRSATMIARALRMPTTFESMQRNASRRCARGVPRIVRTPAIL